MSLKNLPRNIQLAVEKYNISFAVTSSELEPLDKVFIRALELRDFEKVKGFANKLTRINVNLQASLFTGYQFIKSKVWYQRVNNGRIARFYIDTDREIVDYLRDVLYI